MNEFEIRSTAGRRERIPADTCSHDVFDLIFLVAGEEVRRLPMAAVSDVRDLGPIDPPMILVPAVAPSAGDGWRHMERATSGPSTESVGMPFAAGIPSRSGPRSRSLQGTGHDLQAM